VIRWVVRVRAEHAEAALARLLDASPAGLQELDDGAFVVYDEPPSLPGLISVREEVVPDGWETAFHAHVPRVTAGRFAVRPPWVEGEPGDLVIDPGTAFGAGTHATTQLCLELLGEGGGSLADWGSGTGVLAIAAARAGYAPVRAYEVEDVAPIRANAAANGVSLEAVRAEVARERVPAADTVVANLTLPLLEAVARVQPRPGTLIASGVLTNQADGLATTFGMTERERRERDGWAAVVLA
jgi:ribosomal protein L11 methyltransferase